MDEKAKWEEFTKLSTRMEIEYAKTVSPIIWHQIAMYWVRDFPRDFIDWLVVNPNTSPATALMIYWKLGSSYLKKYKDRKEVLKQIPIFITEYDLSRFIENKYLEGFYKGNQIIFDPNQPDEDDVIWAQEYENIEDVRGIPAVMYEKTKGIEVLPPLDFIEGLPLELFCEIRFLMDRLGV